MGNMAFSHTVDQILAETKTVTRLLGWLKLKPGDRFWAVEKTMGLKPGEKVRRLKLCECVSNRRESLMDVTLADVAREGFPDMSQYEFIRMFCQINRPCQDDWLVSRIEFKYVAEAASAAGGEIKP